MTPRMVRDDEGAAQLANARGVVIPPIYEEMRSVTGTHFRRCFIGWRVTDGEKDHGYVILFSSVDGEDYEIMADGGWTMREARSLFRMIFNDMNQPRVSARCKAENTKNISALQRMGFVIEGRKRLTGGDIINLGMIREECRFLKGA